MHASELARNYEDSPAVAQKLASRVPKQEPGAPSPLKSGDTYEDMKRKMTFFPDGDSTALGDAMAGYYELLSPMLTPCQTRWIVRRARA